MRGDEVVRGGTGDACEIAEFRPKSAWNVYCHRTGDQVDLFMGFHVRRVFGDALVSAGVVAMILVVLVSVDVRVREQMSRLLTSASLDSGGETWRQLGSTLVDAVRTQSIEHAPMTIFVVVGAVLLLFMVRS